MKRIQWDKYDFEVVEKITKGFDIWCLPMIEVDGVNYLPICQAVRPDDKDCYDVNTRTIKAIQIDDLEVLEILKKAGHRGGGNLQKCKETIKRCKNAKSGFARDKYNACLLALPYLEKLS